MFVGALESRSVLRRSVPDRLHNGRRDLAFLQSLMGGGDRQITQAMPEIQTEEWFFEQRLTTNRDIVLVGSPISNFATGAINGRLPVFFGAVESSYSGSHRALLLRGDQKALSERVPHYRPDVSFPGFGSAVIEVVRNPWNSGGGSLITVVMGIRGEGTKAALWSLLNPETSDFTLEKLLSNQARFVLVENRRPPRPLVIASKEFERPPFLPVPS